LPCNPKGFSTFQERIRKIPKKEGKRVIWRLFQTPRPTRKLRIEVTNSPGQARLLQVEATACLGELLFNLLPSFPINRHEAAEVMNSTSYIERILAKLVRRRRKKKKQG